jgi:hypothetical protein
MWTLLLGPVVWQKKSWKINVKTKARSDASNAHAAICQLMVGSTGGNSFRMANFCAPKCDAQVGDPGWASLEARALVKRLVEECNGDE